MFFFLEDTKSLLSMLNGDHVWNMYVKKNGLRGPASGGVRPNYREVGGAHEKRTKAAKGVNPANGRRLAAAERVAFNIMDVKELLSYTKNRLEFLQT